MAEEIKKPAAPAPTPAAQTAETIGLLKQIQEHKKTIAEGLHYKDLYEESEAARQSVVKAFKDGDFIRPEDMSGAKKEEEFKKAHEIFFAEPGTSNNLARIPAALTMRNHIKETTGQDIFATRGARVQGDRNLSAAQAEDLAKNLSELVETSHGSLELLEANMTMAMRPFMKGGR